MKIKYRIPRQARLSRGSATIRFDIVREDDGRACACWGTSMIHGVRVRCGAGSGPYAHSTDAAVAHALRVLADLILAGGIPPAQAQPQSG